MILFLGTRPGKTEIKKLDDVACPYCNKTDTLTASKTGNWFHFFWIKLLRYRIPYSPNVPIANGSILRRNFLKK